MTTTITIRRGPVSSRIASPSADVTHLIRRSVPAAGREYDAGTGEWVIFGSRVKVLLEALRAAGHRVIESSAEALNG